MARNRKPLTKEQLERARWRARQRQRMLRRQDLQAFTQMVTTGKYRTAVQRAKDKILERRAAKANPEDKRPARGGRPRKSTKEQNGGKPRKSAKEQKGGKPSQPTDQQEGKPRRQMTEDQRERKRQRDRERRAKAKLSEGSGSAPEEQQGGKPQQSGEQQQEGKRRPLTEEQRERKRQRDRERRARAKLPAGSEPAPEELGCLLTEQWTDEQQRIELRWLAAEQQRLESQQLTEEQQESYPQQWTEEQPKSQTRQLTAEQRERKRERDRERSKLMRGRYHEKPRTPQQRERDRLRAQAARHRAKLVRYGPAQQQEGEVKGYIPKDLTEEQRARKIELQRNRRAMRRAAGKEQAKSLGTAEGSKDCHDPSPAHALQSDEGCVEDEDDDEATPADYLSVEIKVEPVEGDPSGDPAST
ncbi:RNA-binding protein 25-like [Thrips palmi]|uniref:RNA-binding protein 25-like n=1 Tax=Thrips palmi TaxID=161013 RepID=A0A6P8ZH53_THRPL|nr:RNA-binding protein 25-like [Thrips palmi]